MDFFFIWRIKWIEFELTDAGFTGKAKDMSTLLPGNSLYESRYSLKLPLSHEQWPKILEIGLASGDACFAVNSPTL